MGIIKKTNVAILVMNGSYCSRGIWKEKNTEMNIDAVSSPSSIPHLYLVFPSTTLPLHLLLSAVKKCGFKLQARRLAAIFSECARMECNKST